jgi:hypothetical protein
MIKIPADEFRRLIGHIQEYLDNPNLPNMMAKISIDTLKMYDIEAYNVDQVN